MARARTLALIKRPENVGLLLLGLTLSVSAATHIHFTGYTTAFRDSVARLTLGRSMTDATNPGIQQNGAIWPPLPQAFMHPWVDIDPLYRTGIGGAIPQMICYVIASFVMYHFVKLWTGDKFCGLIGFTIMSTPNVLTMQSVPMAESMFICFTTVGLYFLYRWSLNPAAYGWLMASGMSVWGACYTRYEGYVLALCMLPLIVVITWKDLAGQTTRLKFEGVIAFACSFGAFIGFGAAVWCLFGFVFFGDFFYFARSAYSPWAVAKESLSYLDDRYKTGGKLGFSFLVYSRTVIDNVGIIPIIVALYGVVMAARSRAPLAVKAIPFVALFPYFFFIGALYSGSSVVIWHPDYVMGLNWATRYGTLMIPAVALFCAYAAAGAQRWLKLMLLLAIIGTSVTMWQEGPISLGEAEMNQKDGETAVQHIAAEWLRNNYTGGNVLIQRVDNEWITFENGIHLKMQVSENSTSPVWEAALSDPLSARIDWIVMRKQQRNGKVDSVWRSLHDTRLLAENYTRVYNEGGVEIFRKK